MARAYRRTRVVKVQLSLLFPTTLRGGRRPRKSLHSTRLANLAFSFPQFRQLRASGYGRLHVLHRNPFERTMRVVLTAKQVWGRKAELGQA
jgi:hypothetical protein